MVAYLIAIQKVVAGSNPVFCTNIAGCMKMVSGESHKLVRKPRRFESSSRYQINFFLM